MPPTHTRSKAAGAENQFIFVNTVIGSESCNLLRKRKSQVTLRERRHVALRSLALSRDTRQRQSQQAYPNILSEGPNPLPSSALEHCRHQDLEREDEDDNQIPRQKSKSGGKKKELSVVPRLPLTICFQNDAVDPFNATATGVDRWTHNVVQYYIHKLTPDCFIAESRPSQPKPEQFNLAISSRIHACLSDELHMYSMMASCSSRMRRFECVATEKKSQSPEYFVHKAVMALRRKLSQGVTALDPSTFLDIVSLSVAEAFMHNHEAAATHLHLIKRLGTEMGGWKMFDAYLLELFSIADINVAIEANSVPILPQEWIEWKQDTFPAQRMAEVLDLALNEASLPSLEPGNLPGWDVEYFSPAILAIINDLRVYLQAARYIWNQPQSMPGDRKWIFLRGTGITHRLLSLKKGSQSDSSPQPEIEECCRVALILLSHAISAHARARQFVKNWVPRLKDALLRSNGSLRETIGRKNHWLERPVIFLWVLNVGIFVAEGTDEEGWFLAEAARAAAIIGVSPRSAYRRFIQTFFFLDDARRDDLLEVWRGLERHDDAG